MRIATLSEATEDLLNGYQFYERQAPGRAKIAWSSFNLDREAPRKPTSVTSDGCREPKSEGRRLTIA